MGKYNTYFHQKYFLTPLRLDFNPKVEVPFSLLFQSPLGTWCGRCGGDWIHSTLHWMLGWVSCDSELMLCSWVVKQFLPHYCNLLVAKQNSY